MCMGCGISKFDHEEAGPTFNRLTKRNVPHSNIENDGTLASEQLLQEYGAKDESSPDRNINNDRKSVSSWTGNKLEPDVRDQVNAKNNGGGVSAGGSKDHLGGFDRKIKVTAGEERGGDGGGGGGGYNNSSEREKNEEENVSFCDREDQIAGPASPSFREYCVDPRDDINEGEGFLH
ncbi:hypothetical protein Pint_03054 [Pistacia integerrima]|uniref:Uncharacterized protein n=1 Tax=Pistacia integerrima TaxID=434235 RepID=A0ACC0ZLT6_9ROSI|nr:hypothetical protein Pint_03054 [Pistacia integerrima]